MFAIALMGRWAWLGVDERATRHAADSSAAANVTATPAADSDEAERHATVQLLAAYVVSAAGSSASELVSAAHDGTPRPGLDADLRDDDGLKMLVARVADLDGLQVEVEADAELHVAALRSQHAEWGDLEISEHAWRALAALRAPLADAVDALAPWADALVAEPANPPAESGRPVDSGNARCVRVLIGWPLAWNALEQELGRVVATEWLTRSGARALPGTLFALNAQAIGGEDLLLQADRLMLMLARAHHSEPVIVAACHSMVSAEAVMSLENAGLLHHAQKRPKGHFPAEAAAALVLAGADWPAAPDADQTPPHLHRPALLLRDKSVDAPGRTGPQTAMQAIDSALGTGRLDAATVASLVGDADQHTERATEFYRAAAHALPHLDAGDDIRAIGHVTGAVGGVSALLVVACAAEVARSAEQPCMALTVGDGHARLALVVLPSAPVAAGLPAAAPAATSA
ncbi:MAG: hypothetical protein ABI281_08850 [Caldimonas sp.]